MFSAVSYPDCILYPVLSLPDSIGRSARLLNSLLHKRFPHVLPKLASLDTEIQQMVPKPRNHCWASAKSPKPAPLWESAGHWLASPAHIMLPLVKTVTWLIFLFPFLPFLYLSDPVTSKPHSIWCLILFFNSGLSVLLLLWHLNGYTIYWWLLYLAPFPC